MKKALLILPTILFLLIEYISHGAIKVDEKGKASMELKLNNEVFLTDTTGVFNVKAVVDLNVGDNIKIYLVDGKIIKGLVKSVEAVNLDLLKIYGDVTNDSNANFGFIINKQGDFGGAVLYRDKNLTYKLVYNNIVKGYVLLADKFSN